MDSASFDQLTRLVSTAAPRRTVLLALAGSCTRLLHPATVAAQSRSLCRPLGGRCFPDRGLDCCRGASCRDRRCRCPAGKQRCGNRCIPAKRCCRDRCRGGALCRNDRCVCAAGQQRCQGRCIPQTACCGDRDCGACERCQQGTCRPTCAADQACQAGTCRCDPERCAGCCAGETCASGDTVTQCGGDGEPCQTCGAGELCGGPACGCMPDPTACLAPGAVCPGGNCDTCCSSGGYACGSGDFCCGNSVAGDRCGPDVICEYQGVIYDCSCNRCCVRSGLDTTAAPGGATCADCCSGACVPSTTICA